MYLVNKHGILHVAPGTKMTQDQIDDGHRLATEHEIAIYKETGEQVVARMPPEPVATPKKHADKGEKE